MFHPIVLLSRSSSFPGFDYALPRRPALLARCVAVCDAWNCGDAWNCEPLKPTWLVPLRSADADFSCFADLALVSPDDYYREGEGSLMQCVLTPADPYLPLPNEEIAKRVDSQVQMRTLCTAVDSTAENASAWFSDRGVKTRHELCAAAMPGSVPVQCSCRLGCLMKHEQTLVASE